MNNYNIRCKVIEEELRDVWPEWHVACHLGGGSFGDVFQIYRDNYGIRLDSALKVIQANDLMTMEALTSDRQDGSWSDIPEALRSEIQIMEALRGAPNIVSIEDFAYKRIGHTSTLFVRMELLTSLEQVLSERSGHGTLSSVGEIIKLGMDVCRALMYCEKRGIGKSVCRQVRGLQGGRFRCLEADGCSICGAEYDRNRYGLLYGAGNLSGTIL